MFPVTFFDYNGVLVDDEHVHLEAYRDVLRPLGVELGEKEYWDLYLGFDDAGAFRAILTDRGRPPNDDEVRNCVERKRPHYLERARSGLRTFPGAAELVRRRASAGAVAVVSGALRDEIVLGLSVLGTPDAVSAIVAADDTERSKPDPEGYLLGIQALSPLVGEEAARAGLVIEDSMAGIEAAKGAGLACIGVGHTYPLDALEKAGADAVVPDLAGITDEMLGALYRRIRAR